MSKRFSLLFTLVIATTLLLSCVVPTPQAVVQTQAVEKEAVVTQAPAPAQASPGEDTLVVNLDRVVGGGMDATQTIESTGKKASFHISETLVEFDEATNTVKPKLAEKWEASPDGLTYTFFLRRGVTFHDGSPFNADAVVASIMRIYDDNHPLHETGVFPYASFTPIETVEKVDDYTVKVTATRQDPIFLWRMTMEPTYIQSPTAIEKWGKEYTNHAVGTGPFKLVSFDSQSKIVMERNEDYWGTKPSFKNLIFTINPDDQSKLADFLAGNVDIITRPPADEMERLASTPGVKVDAFPLRWLGYITLNTSTVPFDDKLVRQAVNYAFDRETLSNILNKGTSKPYYSIWFEGAYAYEPDVTKYAFDPAKAITLLEQAGWLMPEGRPVREKDGTPLVVRLAQAGTLYGPEAPIPELFQANMREIGMDVKIVKIDPAVFFDEKVGAMNPTVSEADVFGEIAFVPDPSLVFDRYTKASIPPGGYNISFYSNPTVEDLYAKSLSELDLDKRADYFKQIQKIVMDEVPVLPHSLVTLPMAWSDRVSGFKVRGNVTLDLASVTIQK